MKTFFILLGLFVLVAGRAEPADVGQHWVGTWGTAPQLTEPRNLPPPPGLASNTLRQVVHVSMGGEKMRVRFSNAFGNGPLAMAVVRVAVSAGGSAIKTETEKVLTFSGQPSATISVGETILSDTLDFDLAPLSDVAVTICFHETPGDVTGHPGSRTTSFLEAGDTVSAAELPAAARTQHWYVLTGIDVQAEISAAAVVVLGDSITDGRGSETDKNNRWPDDLANRLQTNASTRMVAVLNKGIGGNCVLRGGLGPTAAARFDRDVLGQESVRWLMVLEGVNDIGGSRGTNSTVTEDLISAYQKFIDRAHAKKIRILGATILPFGGSQYAGTGHEAARQAVNDWIRTSGKFDAVVDFDAAVRDPQNPSKLLPAADSGDHLHPSVKGHQMMADCTDLKLFEN
jgi:lysophospholipase L1-like esterase